MIDRLRVIVAKASSTTERLGPELEPLPVSAGSAEVAAIDARIDAWRRTVERGDTGTFRRRLAWQGLDETSVRHALGPVRLHADAALPAWAALLGEVLEHAAGSGPTGAIDRCADPAKPLPFEDVLMPFVVWAREHYEAGAGASGARWSIGARTALERQLLEWLSVRSAPTLALELALERASSESSLDAFFSTAPSRSAYGALAARLRSTHGLRDFFEEYAVLARVLATTTQLWIEATLELFARLDADVALLSDALGIDASRVTAVSPSLSDPHHGLRSVCVLGFESQQRVVYKPRALGVESAWNTLLAGLDALGMPVKLRTFRTIDRGEHGWAEHVDYAPCRDSAEASRFFERAGALACLVYLLHGSDFHGDNVIAAADHPVLIDLETVLAPQTPSGLEGADALRLARTRLSRSVLATYFLPLWALSPGGEAYDGSGLGGEVEQQHALVWWRWVHINTDRMAYERGPLGVSVHPRAALSDGSPLHVYDFERELVRGFASTYRFLISARNELLAPASALAAFRDVEVRFVHRNTSLYSTILEQLRRPERLRDGADRSLVIEQLAVAGLVGERLAERLGVSSVWREIFAAERAAIERGDVPHFSARSSDDGLHLGPDQVLPGWFTQAGYAGARERLGALDEADLAFQRDLICSALRSRAPSNAAVTVSDGAECADTSASVADAERALIAEALVIARGLERDAIRGADGSACFIEPAPTRERILAAPDSENFIAGHSLYSGCVGIALFLSAAAEVAANGAEPQLAPSLRELALATVAPLLQELDARAPALAAELGIGGYAGLGSVVYGLTQLARSTGESSLLDAAMRTARLITAERIAADVALDITAGAAGALLGLCALHEANGDAEALAMARCCSTHLVARIEPALGTSRSIRTLDGRFLTGFSHGASGIAHGLLRLWSITQEREPLDAARDLLAFERAAFSNEARDWPDFRDPDSARFACAWCHGAPGIALARLSMLHIGDEQHTRAELDRALELTVARAREPSKIACDFVCCGAFGLVDILGTAGRVLGRIDLRLDAVQLAQRQMLSARRTGHYRLALPSAGQLECRSLFQGTSGVGYALLRLAQPSLPDVLALR